MSAAYSYSQGIRLYRQGRFDAAIAALTPASAEPGLLGRLARYYQAQACRRNGMALARAGQLQAAQEYLRRTVKLIGPNADLAYYLARIYTHMGRSDRAEAQLEALAETHKDDPAAQSALAVAQHRNGRGTEAVLTLREAIRRHPKSPELHVKLGLMLVRDAAGDDPAEAIACFAKALECDCLHAEAHYYLGLCHAGRGACADAVRHLERAHSLRPHDVLWTYQLALAARAAAEQGAPVQLALHEPAGPQAATSLHHLAEFVTAENDFVSAFLSLPESPVDDEIFGLLAAVLERAMELHPNYADLALRASLVMQRLGLAAAAVEHAAAAVRINPGYVQARIHLGKLLAESDPAAAEEHLLQAVRCGGDYADVHAELARLYDRAGRAPEAQEEWRQSLRINPNFAQAREAVEKLAA